MSDFQVLTTETLEEDTSIEKIVTFTDKNNNNSQYRVNAYDQIQTELTELKSVKLDVYLKSTDYVDTKKTKVINSPTFSNSVQVSIAEVADKSVYISKAIPGWSIQDELMVFSKITNFIRGSSLSRRNVRIYYSLTNGMTWNELDQVDGVISNSDEYKFTIGSKRAVSTLSFPFKNEFPNSADKLFSFSVYNYYDGKCYVFYVVRKSDLIFPDENNYVRNISIDVSHSSSLSEMTQKIMSDVATKGNFIVNKIGDGAIKIMSKINGYHEFPTVVANSNEITLDNLYYNRLLSSESNMVGIGVSITNVSDKPKINFMTGFSPRIKIELYVLDSNKQLRPAVKDLRVIARKSHP